MIQFILKDPVFCSDGHTFSSASIETLLAREYIAPNTFRCPVDRALIKPVGKDNAIRRVANWYWVAQAVLRDFAP